MMTATMQALVLVLLVLASLAASCSLASAVTTSTPSVGSWAQQHSAAWKPRTARSAFVQGGAAWVVGGASASGALADVWKLASFDGPWKQVQSKPPWQARQWHSVATNGTIMVMSGGYAGAGEWLANVWHSADGVHWLQATAQAPWQARSGHVTAFFQSKLWLFGGNTGQTYHNDLWSSSDGGATWEPHGTAVWTARSGASLVEFKGQLLMIGGRGAEHFKQDPKGFFNDVWRTSNGLAWDLIVPAAPWPARAMAAAFVYSGRVYLIGGQNHDSAALPDVWQTPDGTSWYNVTNQPPFTPRREGGAVVMGDSVALFGGATVTAKNPSTTVYLNTFWKSHPLLLCEYSGSICSSHGLCINRTCHCEFGWLDAACDVSYCLPDACMHGECKNRTIVPPSSTPTIIPPPGHGIVITTTTTTTATTATTATAAGHRRLDVVHPPGSVCSCDPYWTGFNCTDALCAAGCHHGTCVNAPNTCTCDNGYYGSTCSRFSSFALVGHWINDHVRNMYIGIGAGCLAIVLASSLYMNYYVRRAAAILHARSASAGRRVRFAEE